MIVLKVVGKLALAVFLVLFMCAVGVEAIKIKMEDRKASQMAGAQPK